MNRRSTGESIFKRRSFKRKKYTIENNRFQIDDDENSNDSQQENTNDNCQKHINASKINRNKSPKCNFPKIVEKKRTQQLPIDLESDQEDVTYNPDGVTNESVKIQDPTLSISSRNIISNLEPTTSKRYNPIILKSSPNIRNAESVNIIGNKNIEKSLSNNWDDILTSNVNDDTLKIKNINDFTISDLDSDTDFNLELAEEKILENCQQDSYNIDDDDDNDENDIEPNNDSLIPNKTNQLEDYTIESLPPSDNIIETNADTNQNNICSMADQQQLQSNSNPPNTYISPKQKLKRKKGGYVEDLLMALNRSKSMYNYWIHFRNTNAIPPGHRAHIDKVETSYGRLIVHFKKDNKNTACILDSSYADKIKENDTIEINLDNLNPYQLDDGTQVYVGCNLIKL